MARFVSFLNPSLVDQEGLHKYLTRLFGPGVATAFNANGWKVTQRGAGANMSVDVAVGDGLLARPSGDYGFWGWTTATENVAVTAANPTNPRIDTVVAWVDTSVTTTGSANSPNALKFQIMAGTPAGSPVAMPDVTIQSTLGVAAAWIKLATINVAAGSTSVVNANISDVRTGIAGLVNSAVADGAISTAKLATNAVTADKLATNAVTLGYAQITSNFSTASTTATLVTGLSAAVTIPAGGRRVKVTAFVEAIYNSTASYMTLAIWDGSVGSGTKVSQSQFYQVGSTAQSTTISCIGVVTPPAGSKTYNISFHTSGGTANIEAAATYPAFILVEAI